MAGEGGQIEWDQKDSAISVAWFVRVLATAATTGAQFF